VRWEFWPMWAIYPPSVLYLFWLAIRHRHFMLWANCNPAMPASGLALESKGGILDSFEGPDGQIKVARYLRIEPGAADAEQQILQSGFAFPIVLKPDLGQRGQGVKIVQNEEEARAWLAGCEDGVVVQEYIEGLEFGVHWSKHPREEKGEIRSLCGKHPQKVIGDGQSTLEELILRDDRAVMMQAFYFKKYHSDLQRILEGGEEFWIAPIGTHSRGAVFTDERHLVTEDLVAAFDELGLRFEGFHFGRYDVKVPSIEDLKAGRSIAVLELNAVTGEPAHIYHPGYSWWSGMKDFRAHFRRATEIGLAWREQGVEPPSFSEVWSLAMEHREKNYYEAPDFKNLRDDA